VGFSKVLVTSETLRQLESDASHSGNSHAPRIRLQRLVRHHCDILLRCLWLLLPVALARKTSEVKADELSFVLWAAPALNR